MIWLLGGYMWLFIHRPFEVWPWLAPLHVERVYMLVTIGYWALSVEKVWIKNRLNAAFVFFWLVLLVAWVASPYSALGTQTVEDYFKVAVFYVLVISSVRTERDLKLLVMLFLGAMAVYMAHSLWEYHNGRHVYRMGTARMVGVDVTNGDPNSFAGTIVCSLPLVLPVWNYLKGSRFRWLPLGYIGLATTCIMLTGSRMGFVGLGALSLIAALLSKHRLLIITMLAMGAPIVWNLLPHDRQERYLTLIDPSHGPANAQGSAESRWQGWRDGVQLWRECPVFGVGPGGFGPSRGSGLQTYNLRGVQSHQLYGQVLGELGTLGAVAFGMLILGFVINYLRLRRICQREPEFRGRFLAQLIQSVTVSIALLLLMGFAGHNLYSYRWLWFGAFQVIALDCIRRSQQESANEMRLLAVGTAQCTAGEYSVV